MNYTVNSDEAERIIRQAIHEVKGGTWSPSGKHSKKISEIILGTHKTYRYILINGILAKATNDKCNPLCLQSGSSLEGAFDARSLCHKIIVPIERELLGGRLGESNEPFLNKPARFSELSSNNAVRRGNDTETLIKTIDVLSNLKNSSEAYTALKDCIYWVLQRSSQNLSEIIQYNEGHFYPAALIEFSNELTRLSYEGETCAILAGITFDIIGRACKRNFSVVTHKINQSGASSREVSDIDIYENDVLIFSAEVKDKAFSDYDVQHAVNKIVRAGMDTLIFIKGPRGSLVGCTEGELVNSWLERGVNIHFLDVNQFFSSTLSTSPDIDKQSFVGWVSKHTTSAKVKDETLKHVANCISRI